MNRIVPALVRLVALSQAAVGDVILATMGSPLVLFAGTTSANLMSIKVASDDSDVLLGWQIPLLIVPHVRVSGAIGFHAASPPAADYVFEMPSDFFYATISTSMTPDDKLSATDLDIPNGSLGREP